MPGPLSRLGTVMEDFTTYEWVRAGWSRRERAVPRTIRILDWTVDGRPLREHLAWPDGEVPGETTALRLGDDTEQLGAQSVRALMGHFDADGCNTRMRDGRVAILFCPACFDLDCRTVTAEILLGDDTVQWRNIGWQVAFESFDPLRQEDVPLVTLTFDRQQYEREISSVLARLSSRS